MPSFLNPVMEALNTDTFGSFTLIVIGYVALLWLSIIIWVTRDALSRSNSILFQAFSILLTIGIPILGVLIYLIIRPSKTLMDRYYEKLETNVLEDEEKQLEPLKQTCEKCFTEVQDDFVYCPKCAFQLKKVCHSCKKAFADKWTFCPFCGKEHKVKSISPRVSKKLPNKTEIIEEENSELNLSSID